MTAPRIEHLANLADEAAWAHTMAVAARTARIMAAHEARAETTQRLQAQPNQISAGNGAGQ